MIRTIGRATNSSSSSASCGYSVGSPPDSIKTSRRPSSRDSFASTFAKMSANEATPVSAGPDAVKHVGHLRLQCSVTSWIRMQVCWVWNAGSP